MRYSIPFFFLALCYCSSFLGFQSCSGPDRSERIDKVDSLQKDLDQLKERFAAIDTGRALELKERVKKEEKIFENHFDSDSMGEDLFKVLESYKRTRKAFEGYRKGLESMEQELSKSEEQLKDLRKDLKNGALSEEKANRYIEDEAAVIERLNNELEKLETKTKAGFRNFKDRPADLSEYLEVPDSVEWPGNEKQ